MNPSQCVNPINICRLWSVSSFAYALSTWRASSAEAAGDPNAVNPDATTDKCTSDGVEVGLETREIKWPIYAYCVIIFVIYFKVHLP